MSVKKKWHNPLLELFFIFSFEAYRRRQFLLPIMMGKIGLAQKEKGDSSLALYALQKIKRVQLELQSNNPKQGLEGPNEG